MPQGLIAACSTGHLTIKGCSSPLSDRDRDLFLSLLDNPPPATESLEKAAWRHKGRG